MKLGVIIVTYNRLELLKECIEACINQSYKFKEILIVDNASSDGTKEYLSNLKNKSITIKTLDKNSGGAGGFCEGVNYFKKSDLDYILLIDDDAIISKDYNKIINNYMIQADKMIVGYSGTVMTDNKIQYNHRRFLDNLKKFKERNSTYNDYQKEYFDYNLSTFCGVFIPVKIINKIGLPQKDFFIWFDDTEYTLRLNKFGKIRNINSALLNHKTSIEQNISYNWKSYYGLRNRIYIYKNYFSSAELYKYIFYLKLKSLYEKILFIIKKDNYFLNISNMYKDALNDGMKNNMGKSEKYYPGRKLRGE